MSFRILTGHVLDRLAELPDESVHCVVTSPPYWGLRDYGTDPQVWGGDEGCNHEWGAIIVERATNHTDKRRWQHTRNGRDEEQPTHKRVAWLRADVPQGQYCQLCGAWGGSLGLEPDYRLYVKHVVEIFEEIRRVLRRDGVAWLNLGDCYATGAGKVGDHPGGGEQGERWAGRGIHTAGNSGKSAPRIAAMGPMTQPNRLPIAGLKPKDIVGVPWRVAFALQEAGWWVRQDIIWSKPNPMPESVQDRCTKAHEYLFLLSKSERYAYDADSIREQAVGIDIGDIDGGPQKLPDGSDANLGRNYRQPNSPSSIASPYGQGFTRRAGRSGNKERRPASDRGVPVSPENIGKITGGVAGSVPWEGFSRNKRSVWEIPTTPFPDAHFAVFPTALVEPCILAGSPKGGVVLDPFLGAGTTALVADRLGRDCIGIDLNPDYTAMAERRVREDAGMFANIAAK